MISWMQKHNKYLVWTIWIATIAFIGAGFVGWGSYSFGSKAGNIAKVGEVEVSQNSLNMTYSNLYAQYNQMMEGKLDDAKAKELGLVQQAFSMLTTQAKVLNLAKENGIVISDQELLEALQNIKAFQDDGLFNQEVYNMYLTTQQMNAKTFEARLRDELTISKTFEMLQMDALPFETQVFAAAMGISDQIQYKVLTFNDVNVSVENEKLKSYWEMNKENFKTPKQYTLSLLRTEKSDVAITEEELQAHYTANSFNYTDSEGKQLTLEEAKEAVTKDLQLRKSKKSAQKAYIGMKKGEINATESVTVPLNDPMLTQEIWSEILTKNQGEILKPKVVDEQYVTIRIDSVIFPEAMAFAQAKPMVENQVKLQEYKKGLIALADKTLQHFDSLETTLSEFLSLDKSVNLAPLNSEESLQFMQELFTSPKETGIISVSNSKAVVYKIVAQKTVSLDENQTQYIEQSVNDVKRRVFENNLLKRLGQRYATEVYVKGLTQ